jgi:hypothetical protein
MAATIVVAFLIASAGTASAAPGPGDEGGTQSLRQQLEAAGKGFIEAQAALDASIKRQADLTQQVAANEVRYAALSTDAAALAVAAYRAGGNLRTVSALLESGSPGSFYERAATLNAINMGNDRHLRELTQLRKKLAEDKAAIDAEVVTQQQQRDAMAKKKADVERALRGSTSSLVNAGSPSARPAPRNPDGSWPRESCIVREPDRGEGCVTPRMAHLIAESKTAGFTRHRSCWRSANDGGEHPVGKACDYAAAPGGFGGVATGADKAYGDRLSNWLIANARNLAVYYIIWYRRIWHVTNPGVWRSYGGSTGAPNTDHTNHTHVSIY